jgi:CRP/FNR family transcriptional regulator, cyclic AMP receptor protein
VPNPIRPQVLRALPDVERFVQHCHRYHVASKTGILRTGEAGASLYLLLDGSVSVVLEDEAEHSMKWWSAI